MQTEVKEKVLPVKNDEDDIEFFANADLTCLSNLISEFEIDAYKGQEMIFTIAFNSVNQPHLNSTIKMITSAEEIPPFTEYDYDDIQKKFESGVEQEFVVEPMKIQKMLYYIFGILLNSRECSDMIINMDISVNHDTDEVNIYIDYDETCGVLENHNFMNLGLDDFFTNDEFMNIQSLSEQDPNSLVDMQEFNFVYVDNENIFNEIVKTLCTHQDDISLEFASGKYLSTHHVINEYQNY